MEIGKQSDRIKIDIFMGTNEGLIPKKRRNGILQLDDLCAFTATWL
jgi:hypothetical protein